MHQIKKSDIQDSKDFEIYLSKVYEEINITVQKRVTFENDQKLQINGVDLIIQENGRKVNIDEKARIDYINKDNIPGFAFEINSINSDGERRDAWLLAPSLTDRYHLATKIEGTVKDPKGCCIRSLDKNDLLGGISRYLSLERINIYKKVIVETIEKYKIVRYSQEGSIIKILSKEDEKNLQKELEKINEVTYVKIDESKIIIKIKELTHMSIENGWFVYTFKKKEKPLNLFLKFWYLDNICNSKVIFNVSRN